MKTRFFILISLFGLIACKPDLEHVQLEVSVSSGITGVSLEGYKVKVFGPETMVSSIDTDGKAYFDFEAPLGETYLVKFMDNFENFNPQGIAAIEWSPTLTSDKLEDQFTVGGSHKVDLLAIPSCNVSIRIFNDVPEENDSLYLLMQHELFSTEAKLNEDRSGIIFSYSAPIGLYTYEGVSFKKNDTIPISGTFVVPHDDNFSFEINY